jgi:ribosomal protein S18 acetylase RimI-like enzyme
MNLKIKLGTKDINWQAVVELLKETGMGYRAADVHRRAFENSHTVVFVFDNDLLVGFGRAISDGEYQAALYDIAVSLDYQGLGIGKIILQNIINHIPNCNFILYASPGKEKFYEREGFKKMKTGLARFVNEVRMKEKGFIE